MGSCDVKDSSKQNNDSHSRDASGKTVFISQPWLLFLITESSCSPHSHSLSLSEHGFCWESVDCNGISDFKRHISEKFVKLSLVCMWHTCKTQTQTDQHSWAVRHKSQKKNQKKLTPESYRSGSTVFRESTETHRRLYPYLWRGGTFLTWGSHFLQEIYKLNL